MKHIFSILLIISFFTSCKNNKDEKYQHLEKEPYENEVDQVKKSPSQIIKNGDTIIVKQVDEIEDYDSITSRSFSYIWRTNKDTLDLKIHAREYHTDGSTPIFHINIRHSEEMFFSTALKYLKKSIPIIQEDFKLKNLGSLQFESTFLYKDFETTLPKEYESKYGKKRISYLEIDDFLKESSIDDELKKTLFFLKERTYEYAIEKFMVRNSFVTGIAIFVRIKTDE